MTYVTVVVNVKTSILLREVTARGAALDSIQFMYILDSDYTTTVMKTRNAGTYSVFR